MTFITRPFTRIKGISEKRRLPKLGNIRLGFKAKKVTGGREIEYPQELPFLLLPDEVAAIYGGKVTVERAKELGVTRQNVLDFIAKNTHRLAEQVDIFLPINDIDAVFPQSYVYFGSSKGVKCTGDGVDALRYDEKSQNMIECKCPCEKLKTKENPKGQCAMKATLFCILPEVSMGGVYVISVGSYHGIVDLNSALDPKDGYITALIGRMSMIPLVLKRVPRITHNDNQKQTHWTLQLHCDVDVNALNKLKANNALVLSHAESFALPPTDLDNPVPDNSETVDEEPVNKTEQKQIPEQANEVTEPEPVTATKTKQSDFKLESEEGAIVYKQVNDYLNKHKAGNQLFKIKKEMVEEFGLDDSQSKWPVDKLKILLVRLKEGVAKR